MKGWFIKFFASFFYLGYSPIAPGTAGTIGGVILFYFLSNFSLYIYISFFLGFIIFSVWVSTKASGIFGESDPKQVVVDEVCGYLVTMFLITPSLKNMILGFFLFRLLDIVKPPPVRSSERLPGGFGIVTDDVVAGIYANIIMQVITRVIG
ncbi:MAG TPA: phosphatidylglycerophosphatase A [Thermodesulfobacteriota bacterium]|nr:phosphatidylglycerophosphatase A [Thermodesulfobacteriota bacterium]